MESTINITTAFWDCANFCENYKPIGHRNLALDNNTLEFVDMGSRADCKYTEFCTEVRRVIGRLQEKHREG